jgi:hypothetical protein
MVQPPTKNINNENAQKHRLAGVPAIPGLPQWDCPRVAKSPFLSPSFGLLETIAAILKEQLIKHTSSSITQ